MTAVFIITISLLRWMKAHLEKTITCAAVLGKASVGELTVKLAAEGRQGEWVPVGPSRPAQFMGCFLSSALLLSLSIPMGFGFIDPVHQGYTTVSRQLKETGCSISHTSGSGVDDYQKEKEHIIRILRYSSEVREGWTRQKAEATYLFAQAMEQKRLDRLNL